MASLATLRGLVYLYLGTTSSDPAYPATTVTTLLNAVANRYIADVHQQKPDYLSDTTSLTSTTHVYTLPANFAGWLDVRLTDSQGTQLGETRSEELDLGWAGPVFAITGPDGTAVLTTSDSVTAGATLYLKYRTSPAEMSADADTPSWMPTTYHDLLAREAAIDAFGLGNESSPSMLFVDDTRDRRGQFWHSIGRRGVAPMIQRQG